MFVFQGNKGGVGISFKLFDTSICFVNSHFAAHQDEVERRNQVCKNLVCSLLMQDFPVLKMAYFVTVEVSVEYEVGSCVIMLDVLAVHEETCILIV